MGPGMGLFGKRAVECDWCGAPIAGDGITDAGLRLCSQACLEQKNAPPVVEAAPTVPDLRPPSKTIASTELAFATGELELYERIAAHAERDEEEARDELVRAKQAYFGLWKHLETVAGFLGARGADIGDYHVHHRAFQAGAEGFHGGHGRADVGLAILSAENVEHARAAIAALQRALAQLGEG